MAKKDRRLMKIYIKYMISLRCKMVVKSALNALGLSYTRLELGTVELMEEITPDLREQLRATLLLSGLELLDDKKKMLIEKIQQVVVEMVHYADELPAQKYSAYINDKLRHDYRHLSNIFSEVKGITIQQYIILQKIEKAKELLLYDKLTLTEIAYRLHYSSVSHLSSQFKKVTGLTPSFFKDVKKKRYDLEKE